MASHRLRAPHCPREPDTALAALHGDVDALAGHLRVCPDCRAAAADAGLVAAALAGAVAPVTPPPGLRSRVLLDAAASSTPRAARARWSSRLSSRWATAAASLVAVLALAGTGVWFAEQQHASTARATTIAATLAEVRSHRHAILVDPDGHPLAAVTVDGPTLTVYDLGLPDPPPGQAWVLWGLAWDHATRLGTVAPGGQVRMNAGPPVQAYGVSADDDTAQQPGTLAATGGVEEAGQ